MCKVMAFSNATKLVFTEGLLQDIQESMNETDNDGFGYAVLGHDSELWGERTLKKTIQSSFARKELTHKIPHKKKSNKFGKMSTKHKAAIFHARMSTNVKTLEATHPYVDKGIAMIHNGVVSDTNTEPLKLTTGNDTEIIFKYWLRDKLESVQKYVSGYYALAVLDSNTGHLHIVKDSRAALFASFIKELDSYIFCTRESIIKDICERRKWTHGVIEELQDDIHITLDKNNVMSTAEIKPLGYTTAIDSRLVKQSLGYSASESLESEYDSYYGWQNYKDDKYTKGRWHNDEYIYNDKKYSKVK